MSLYIHKKIKDKLEFFINENKIPHIIFYGPSGSGKRTILNKFINDIYDSDKQKINQYVMHVNCAHSKGIRFIRDELKFFAKTNIHNKNNNLFKSIVLFNADQLTMDAQSALRRCIEQFSHTTRFFILVENENRLLKPILSRFCNIYIPLPLINKNLQSLHDYNKLDISQGHMPNVNINQKGIEQSIKTGNYLKDYRLQTVPFDCIISSPLLRAKSTADIIANKVNYKKKYYMMII